VRVIRNTIDVIIGLSLMLFSKSIADRILKEEEKVKSNTAYLVEDDTIMQRLDCQDNSIISPEANVDKMGGLIQDDSFVSTRKCGP